MGHAEEEEERWVTGKTIAWTIVLAVIVCIGYWLFTKKTWGDTKMGGNTTTEVPFQFRQGGYVKDGLYWPPQKTKVVPYTKVDYKVDCNKEKTECEAIVTCDTDLKLLYDILPGETLEITHVMGKGEKDNGCSYSYTGDGYPFYGALGSVYDPKYDDYPIPEEMGIPPQAIALVLRDENNFLVDAKFIKQPAGKVRLTNASASCKKAIARAEYNYPAQLKKEYRQQLGWAGWSTHLTIERISSERSFNEKCS